MNNLKQVTLLLPINVVKRAEEIAKNTIRQDGLKQTAAAQLRQWVLVGMQHASR